MFELRDQLSAIAKQMVSPRSICGVADEEE